MIEMFNDPFSIKDIKNCNPKCRIRECDTQATHSIYGSGWHCDGRPILEYYCDFHYRIYCMSPHERNCTPARCDMNTDDIFRNHIEKYVNKKGYDYESC